MITLFALTGIWFWLTVLASFSCLMWSVHRDYYGYATLDILLVLALWSVTGNLPVLGIWHSMQTNPAIAIGWAGGYVGIGVVWATMKWKLVLRKLKAQFDEWQKERDRDEKHEVERRVISKLEPESEENIRESRHRNFRMAFAGQGLGLLDTGKPKVDVAHYRKRIMGWMAYWPVSTVLWVFGDLLADVFDQLYRMVRGFFQKMADAEFEG